MKNNLLITAALVTMVFVASANAMDFNQYVSAKLTYADASHDIKWVNFNPAGTGTIKFDDEVFGANIAYGVKAGFVRTELELNLKQDAEKKHDSKDNYAKISLENKFAMINVYYDINTGTALTPYVGAGLGVARLKAQEKGGYKFNGKIWNQSKSKTNFAWQIGAGVAYALTENVSVDLGYRYIDEGDVKYSDEYASNEFEAKSHEFSLGVRYNF